MADPTLVMTFSDMILAVAEYLGMAYYGSAGDATAAIPSDAHDLDLCKRLVNAGYRRFIGERNWKFLTPKATLALVASDADYNLPDAFYGSLLEPFTYPADGPRTRIEQIGEPYYRELAAASGTGSTGNPMYFAIRPLAVTPATTGTRWEVLFWPTPSTAYTLTYRYRAWPDALTTTTYRTIAGFQHDRAILAAALAEAERERDEKIGIQHQNYQDALAASIRLDNELAPRTHGDYGDRSDDRFTVARPYTGVDTYNDVAV